MGAFRNRSSPASHFLIKSLLIVLIILEIRYALYA